MSLKHTRVLIVGLVLISSVLFVSNVKAEVTYQDGFNPTRASSSDWCFTPDSNVGIQTGLVQKCDSVTAPTPSLTHSIYQEVVVIPSTPDPEIDISAISLWNYNTTGGAGSITANAILLDETGTSFATSTNTTITTEHGEVRFNFATPVSINSTQQVSEVRFDFTTIGAGGVLPHFGITNGRYPGIPYGLNAYKGLYTHHNLGKTYLFNGSTWQT